MYCDLIYNLTTYIFLQVEMINGWIPTSNVYKEWKKKQWTLWILASSWIFLSSINYVCLLSRAISLCTNTMI
jgi:hypothetical protein